MKRILLTSLGMACVGFSSAQTYVSTTPTNRVAVLEEYTGNFCTYCPDGHKIATNTIEPTGAITLKIQTGSFSGPDPLFGGSLTTPTGELIAAPFDSQGYPNGSVSRAPGATGIGRTSWASKVNTIQSQVSPVNIYVASTIDVTTRQMNVTVEYYYTGAPSSGTNYLHVGYYQDNVPAYQYDPGFNPNQFYIIQDGLYDFDHCFRDMVNGTWGEAISGLTTGSTAIKNYTITLPASFDSFDLEAGAVKVYAFISKTDQGEIVTAKKATPTYTNWPSTNEAGLVYTSVVKNEDCIGQAGTFAPKALIAAYGSAGLSTLDATYGVNGGTTNQTLSNLNLAHNEKKAVTVSTPFTYAATNPYTFAISNPNGSTDPTLSDNSLSGSFNGGNTANADKVRIEVKGDAYMVDEASFQVKDGSGTVVLDVPLGDIPNSSTTQWYIALPQGVDCYTFELHDDYGDGWGSSTTSYFKVLNFTGNVLGGTIKNINTKSSLDADYIAATEFTSNGTALGLTDEDMVQFNVYPNPASEILNISFEANSSNYEVAILDLQGRTVAAKTLESLSGAQTVEFEVSSLAKGSYIVTVTSNGLTKTQNVVIK